MFLLPEIALSLVLLLVLYHGVPALVQCTHPAKALAPQTIQNGLLLVYSWGLFACIAPAFLLLLLIYTLVAVCAFKFVSPAKPVHQAVIGGAWVSLCVGVLFAVKYYNPVREFVAAQWPGFAAMPALNLVLGFSVSFLTFQFITLAVLWWRGALTPQQSPAQLAIYIAFFPTLAAGPITRAQQLLPQLSQARTMIAPRYALARILLGVWQMLVCAQWLAETWVNPIYAAPQNHHGLEVLAAVLAYSLQIYLDFSGLSNIVVGLGWLLGIRLPRNFRSPYAAVNIRDFWRRWHISLSLWIRDYLYKPLGGNRKGFARAQLAVVASMGLSGVWHGAALTFVAWAGMHIAAVMLMNTLDRTKRSWVLPKGLGMALTFAWVSLAWVFFRADNLDHALAIFAAIVNTKVLIQYNVIGFGVLVLAFFILQSRAARWSQTLMARLNQLPMWAFALWVLVSLYFAIELGPQGVPNFIYAGF